MADIELFEGEAKTITFTVIDSDDALVDLSTATLSFAMAPAIDATLTFSKSDSDFDDTNEANGVTSFVMSDTDSGTAGDYVGQLKIIFTAGMDIDKSEMLSILIKPALI